MSPGRVDLERELDGLPHSQRVSRYAVAIAAELGLPDETVEALRLAASLHDIGKGAIDADILGKDEPLTDEDWVEVRNHPVIGANLLLEAGLGDSAAWVLVHHERPDGRGYPYGLRADQIPLPAKILAVADAYDAMRTQRSYKAAMTHRDAAAELRSVAGEQFDGEVVEVLLRVLEPRAEGPEASRLPVDPTARLPTVRAGRRRNRAAPPEKAPVGSR